jgi:serine acetyltransferase
LKSIPAPSSASACFDHAMGVVVGETAEIGDG